MTHSSRVDGFVDQILRDLHAGKSEARAASIQRFFKEPVPSLGWRTDALRRLARSYRKEIGDHAVLLDVAEILFKKSQPHESKTVGVLLLEPLAEKFGDLEFRRFEKWLPHIASWDACDGLCLYLIAPLVAAEPRRARVVFRWAKSSNRWERRGAAVSMVHCARRAIGFQEIFKLCDCLIEDTDDMVQKGVGWVLREVGKKSPARATPYLMKVRHCAPRLVLRTACEKLSVQQRKKILS
jgi:3-methyladenine DNA glycosylase AlkD